MGQWFGLCMILVLLGAVRLVTISLFLPSSSSRRALSSSSLVPSSSSRHLRQRTKPFPSRVAENKNKRKSESSDATTATGANSRYHLYGLNDLVTDAWHWWATVRQAHNPHPRTFWTCGWQTKPILRTLFPYEAYGGELTESSAVDEGDILLHDGGPCPIDTPEDSFKGRILWFDGEWGKPRRDREQDIYFGPLHLWHFEDDGDVFWPFLLTEMLTLNATSQLLAKQTAGSSLQAEHAEGFLVYAQSNCVPYREAAFDAIASMSMQRGLPLPAAIGSCHGSASSLSSNDGSPLELKTRQQRHPDKLRGYRFALVMENQRQPGYVTEKILHAYLADCIPIYYGDRDTVNTMFNPKSYIWYDINDPGPALERILYLETNYTALAEMRERPILAEGAVEKWFSLTDDVGGGLFKRQIRDLLGRRLNRTVVSLRERIVHQHEPFIC